MTDPLFNPCDRVEFWDADRVKQCGVIWYRCQANKGLPLLETWLYDVCLCFGDGSLVRVDEAQLTAVPSWLWERLVAIHMHHTKPEPILPVDDGVADPFEVEEVLR